ncbi:hypothetical protein Metal_3590 [Methylomicrobium album BG8]|uniref:Transposase n=1 Tax=Methylomicrobium album BG8 TaxID=686340 RepID=H8GGF7_METAL|nr:hypothetical protein Metal_3590 [Methylomicrobium album BG8]
MSKAYPMDLRTRVIEACDEEQVIAQAVSGSR